MAEGKKMNTIGELLSRDLSRKIEEIIQVDQPNEQSVYAEISEYVATGSIKKQYAELFKAIAEAPAEPHEGIGVWISGFFGSGKSSFAKNLGYALRNKKIQGEDFAKLFKQKINDKNVSSFLDLINAKIPTEVILFEVAKERDTRKVTERIAELMYTVLLRELDYAEDFDIAELEIELEAENKLKEFIETCTKLHKQDWRIVRKGAQRLSRASAILHQLDKKTYPAADSWAHSQRNRDASVTVSKVVERTFELVSRRRPGKALVFVIDEVGQHVARSGDKIEDLRATVEEFGKIGKNLLKARKIIAPVWIVVTSQEKLEEVVAAIDSRRVELAKLQDRFPNRVDLAPSDIREVATKRVLAKKTEAGPILKKLFSDNQGQLNAALRLERSSRKADVSESDFIEFYPYPPHYVELCIGIMSGIRLQPGAPRHYGGSNRTVIKQAYEMLVSDRTAMASKPVRALVTLDKVFELVEGNLSNERRTDIHDISQRFKENREDSGWSLRVAKVICLLEFIRDLPRTEKNIAAFLVDEVGKPAPLAEVEAAVKRLNQAQFIRNTEEGWKLQTAQEKSWETERRGHLEPKPRERNDIMRAVLRDIFGEPNFRTYRHKDFKSFRVGISIDGTTIGDEGDLTLSLAIADEPDDMAKRIATVRDDSRKESHKNDVYWVFALTPEIDELVAQVHASRKMVEKYEQLRAQNKITTDEATCLQDEKNAVNGYHTRLRDRLIVAMEQGTGMFQGYARPGADLGKNLSDILKTLYAKIIPDLYSKLELGSRPLKGNEAELILKTVDLKALPDVFYAGETGLGLVVKDGAKLVPNQNAEIAKEVFDYLMSEYSYGNKDTRTGKALENRFCGLGYGWDRDMLRLVLAFLFRAGSIEVTYQGNRFHNYQDPLSRTPFTNNVAFRSSLFSPRQSVGLKTLTQAVQQLENLTGVEVDVEESAIASAFKKLATEELERLYPLKALVEANQLPVTALLAGYQQTLVGIQSSPSDDCVRILTETGSILKDTRDKVRKIRDLLNDKTLNLVREAKMVVREIWPRLSVRNAATEVKESAAKLSELLTSDEFVEKLGEIQNYSNTVSDAYRETYVDLFRRRAEAYEKVIDEIKNRPEWEPLAKSVDEDSQVAEMKVEVAQSILDPLLSRKGSPADVESVEKGISLGSATLSEMESDLAAVEALKSAALVKLQDLTLRGERDGPVRRIRLADFFNRPIRSSEELETVFEQLRDTVQKYIDEGALVILE
jgi:hypothetical protein